MNKIFWFCYVKSQLNTRVFIRRHMDAHESRRGCAEVDMCGGSSLPTPAENFVMFSGLNNMSISKRKKMF